jgi:hypothetical protein
VNQTYEDHELLLRRLDGRVTHEEGQAAAQLLRSDAEARAFVREVAEQAVILADLARIAAGRDAEASRHTTAAEAVVRRPASNSWRAWSWSLTAVAISALIAMVSLQVFAKSRQAVLRVVRVTGSGQCFGSNGKIENALVAGVSIGAGDTLETRSCDAWIELALRDGSTMTMAGHSMLRILQAEEGEQRFELTRGSLWVKPAEGVTTESLVFQTPTATVEARNAQLDIQTSSAEMIARVNQGTARVTRVLDGSAVNVPADQQVGIALGDSAPLAAVRRPQPVDHWDGNLAQVPEVILGTWLPPTETERVRLRAAPLLWPISPDDSVMLHAVALAAWKTSDWPVLLHGDSRLRFRGRTERPQTVRFGFSTQRMQGVFAGKFELDVAPQDLGPAGQTWEMDLRLADFRPLHPDLSSSPEGLELTDVYALTIRDDAGLEINHMDLQPPDQRRSDRLRSKE